MFVSSNQTAQIWRLFQTECNLQEAAHGAHGQPSSAEDCCRSLLWQSEVRTSKKKRRLPEYIAKHSDIPHVSVDQQQQAPDGVLNYSSAVLNDGLLMLELRDAIREGDGPRIIQCW